MTLRAWRMWLGRGQHGDNPYQAARAGAQPAAVLCHPRHPDPVWRVGDGAGVGAGTGTGDDVCQAHTRRNCLRKRPLPYFSMFMTPTMAQNAVCMRRHKSHFKAGDTTNLNLLK